MDSLCTCEARYNNKPAEGPKESRYIIIISLNYINSACNYASGNIRISELSENKFWLFVFGLIHTYVIVAFGFFV